MARVSLFPPASLKDALVIAQTIWDRNSGNDTRRLTIFNTLNRKPDSSTSRQLITASGGYDLTQGSYASETLKLTDRGRAIVEHNDAQAKLDAVLGVEIFADFYGRYRKGALPSDQAAKDWLKERGVSEASVQNCLEIILANCEYVGLIQDISGTKRFVSPEHALESLKQQTANSTSPANPVTSPTPAELPQPTIAQVVAPPAQSHSSARVPTVHIDIQIHIAADAKLEQIDQIFASMAKHLYDKG